MAKEENKISRVEKVELIKKVLSRQLDSLRDIPVKETDVFTLMTINNAINNISIACDNVEFLGLIFKTELTGDESNNKDNSGL